MRAVNCPKCPLATASLEVKRQPKVRIGGASFSLGRSVDASLPDLRPAGRARNGEMIPQQMWQGPALERRLFPALPALTDDAHGNRQLGRSLVGNRLIRVGTRGARDSRRAFVAQSDEGRPAAPGTGRRVSRSARMFEAIRSSDRVSNSRK